MPRNRKRKAQAAQQARPATPPMPKIPEPEEEPKTRGWRSEDYVVLYATVPKQLTTVGRVAVERGECGAQYNPSYYTDEVHRMTAFAEGSIDLVICEKSEAAKNPLDESAPEVWTYLLYCFGGRKEFRVLNERPTREFLDFVMPGDLGDEDDDYD